MYFADALAVDRTWTTPEGYLGFSARFARTGIQMYSGREIDPDGIHKDAAGAPRFKANDLYPVNRPENEVFASRAMGSFVAKPITDDHPTDAVTVENWGDRTKGVIAEVLRDGQHARINGLITDKAQIASYRAGKRELSGGYGAEIVIGDGVNVKGEAFVAEQRGIDGNHVAIVDRGRAGSECAIRDALPHCDRAPDSFLDSLTTQEKPVKTMLIDGLTVDIANADTAHATITTILAARDAATGKLTTLEAAAVEHAATVVAKDAQIAKLTNDLAAAKPTLQQLRDAGKAFAVIEGKAKAFGVTVTDAMDEGAIMKAVVDRAMPGNTYAGDHIRIAFETLTKDAKVQDSGVQPIGTPVIVGDAVANERQALTDANDFNSWRNKAA